MEKIVFWIILIVLVISLFAIWKNICDIKKDIYHLKKEIENKDGEDLNEKYKNAYYEKCKLSHGVETARSALVGATLAGLLATIFTYFMNYKGIDVIEYISHVMVNIILIIAVCIIIFGILSYYEKKEIEASYKLLQIENELKEAKSSNTSMNKADSEDSDKDN